MIVLLQTNNFPLVYVNVCKSSGVCGERESVKANQKEIWTRQTWRQLLPGKDPIWNELPWLPQINIFQEYLQRRLQYSPERTYHTPTITSKLLLRLGAPRGARSSWMVFSKRRRSEFVITTPRLNNHWKYLKIHGYTTGLKRLEEVCEKKTFWRTNSKHS